MPEIESTSKPEQELPKKKEEETVRTAAAPDEKPNEITAKPQPEYTINNPILASQVEKRQMKIAKLEDKNTVLSDKIAKNETRIEKQQAKIEDAQKTKAYCKALLESTALPQPLQVFFKSMMDRQETKIKKCNDKIGDLKDKNTNLTDKITKNNKKISKHTAKIESLQKIDKFLTNMQSREGRRENFVQVVSDLRKISLERYSEKAVKLEKKIAQKEASLTKATSSVERVQLRNRITELRLEANEVNLKINKLSAMTVKLEKLTALSDQQAGKVIDNATNSINRQLAANENMSEQTAVDTVVNETGKAITNNEIDNRTTPQNEEKAIIEKLNGEINDDLAFFGEVTYETAQHIKEAGYELNNGNLQKINEQKGQENPLHNVETAVEQNANNIDGVINNLPATTVLFSVEQYDTVRYFIADNISVNDLLSAANDDKAFQALSNIGKPVSEEQFADIQQSDKFNYSVEINLNEESANFYVVNGGKGGISENDRTEKNTNFFSVKTSDYKDKAQQKGTQQDKAKNALGVAALCAAIPNAFAENHDMQTRLLHTTAVFSALAEQFNFDDVKSAVAIGIMDRLSDSTISDPAKDWASKFPLTDTLKPFAEQKGTLPLDMKSGYLDVFAKKVGAWEQSREEKSSAVSSRKEIIGNKPKENEHQKQQQQHDKSTPKKTDKSL